MLRVLTLCCLPLLATQTFAQETTPEPAMTMQRLGEIVLALDPDARVGGNTIEITVSDIPVLIVADAAADRMRAMTPIRSIESVPPEELLRMMQANFDTALDARYAVADGRLWAVFIHPLSPLERAQFISGLGQVVNLALTYGSLYTGGGMTFGGGDSNQIHRDLIEDLLKRGEPI